MPLARSIRDHEDCRKILIDAECLKSLSKASVAELRRKNQQYRVSHLKKEKRTLLEKQKFWEKKIEAMEKTLRKEMPKRLKKVFQREIRRMQKKKTKIFHEIIDKEDDIELTIQRQAELLASEKDAKEKLKLVKNLQESEYPPRFG